LGHETGREESSGTPDSGSPAAAQLDSGAPGWCFGCEPEDCSAAEGGYGIGSENLASIAAALGMDESGLRTQAATAGPPPPEKRISLKQVTSAVVLIDVLERCSERGWSLEVGLPDEHPYNEMIGRM